MSRNRRYPAFLALLVLRERGPVVLLCSALLLLFGWLAVTRWDTRMAYCLAAYERAATAPDSARVDMMQITARGRSTCRNLRRDGTLDRYRQSIEAGRVPWRGDPLIEK